MNRLRRVLRSLLPPPRRAWRWSALWTLAAFGLLMGGVVAWAELTGKVLFARPGAFWLLLAAPWFWWMGLAGHAGLTGWRASTAVLVRLLLVGVFVMLLAEPHMVRTNDRVSVMFVLDVSDSIGEKNREAALGWIAKTVAGKRALDRAGLVVFAREAAVELPPRETFPLEAINSLVARDATDIEKALALAQAVLPEGDRGRIVLISDGNLTDGHLAPTLDALKAREVAVDVLPVQFAFDEEVWLEKLELPHGVKVGETYEAAVVLSALTAGKGTLVLRENGRVIFEKQVEYKAGKNRFTLPIYLRQPGYYQYTATLQVPAAADGWRQNNRAIGEIYLKGTGQVLVVTDPDGERRDHEPLVAALRAAQRLVRVVTAYELPRDAMSMLPYDCIVFVNVPADSMDPAQQRAVKDVVFEQGVGFLMVGGANSFGPGGWHRTDIETLLPVTMDTKQRKVMPKGALAIILHTCEFAQGNTWAKRITMQAIKVLSARDEVGVLIYDGQDRWLFPLTPAGQYAALVPKIRGAQPADMMSFEPTMRMAINALKASDAAAKHCIIISDGDPSMPTPATLGQYVANQVSVSTIAINPHGGIDVGLMKKIAAATGGRYYNPKSPNSLPSIFIKEAKTLKRSMIQNRTFMPKPGFPSPVMKGFVTVPQLHGLVLTSAKPRARSILMAPAEDGDDPLLVTWRYGLAKTAAFTSDLATNWGREWVGWDQYRAFVKQLIGDISRVDRPSQLQLDTFAVGGRGVIEVSDHGAPGAQGAAFMTLQARVRGPHERGKTLALRQVAPGRYRTEFPLWGSGRYQVIAAGAGGGRAEQVLAGFTVPYSAEYLRFRASPVAMDGIARRTGGERLTGEETPEKIFERRRPPRGTSRPVVVLVLILLACLVPLDVAVRRIQIDWAVIRAWFHREAATDATMATLLQRKQSIDFGDDEPRPAPVMRRPAAPVGRPADAARVPARPKAEPEPDPQGPQSTTAHLLALKKRWKNPKESDDE